MNTKTLYLHIGFPKTATSFLQYVVLSEVSSVSCLSKPSFDLGSEGEVAFGTLFNASPAVWEEFGRRLLEKLLDRSADGVSVERSVLVSDEGMTHGPLAPHPWIPGTKQGYEGPERPTYNYGYGAFSIGAHLSELSRVAQDVGFSRIRVLVTIRRQDTMLASYYAELSNKVRGASRENFESWIDYLLSFSEGYGGYYRRAGGKKLDYHLLWKQLSGTLGSENVSILPFELLERDSFSFLKKWLGFVGEITGEEVERVLHEVGQTKTGVRSTSKYTWALRDRKMMGPRLRGDRILKALGLPLRLPIRHPDFHRKKEFHLTEELRDRIIGVFSESNELVDEKVSNLELERYGYY